ncbi:M24 family metallopeptidase [Spirochaeta dissipatitropha]
MSSVQQNLENLRGLMLKSGFSAYIIFSTDPHMSEYVPERWTGRAVFSGFTGSAGTLVVTRSRAALWTDGRYFLQAEKQLEGSGIELMRDGLPDTLDFADFIVAATKTTETTGTTETTAAPIVVGTSADCISIAEARRLQKLFSRKGLQLQASKDLLEQAWVDRPSVPSSALEEFQAEQAGESRIDRLERLKKHMTKLSAQALLIGSLDDLAYLFLFRGSDIPYNPVSVGYALIEEQRIRLYLPEEKHESAAFLAAEGIELLAYSRIFSDLTALPEGCRLMIDPVRTNLALYQSLPAHVQLREAPLPSIAMKAEKNSVEVSNIRRAMQIDGAALLRFLRWLKQHPAVDDLDELQAARKLQELRAEHPQYRGDSFPAIAGFGPNGAIIHYSVNEESARPFNRNGLFLIDSGAHYDCGTTDITRVVCWDRPTDAMRRDYTLVLKAHIALASARFPAGTRGIQLDAIARDCLWREGLDYRHGTGHGVGYCLPVHEGPQSISSRMIDVPLAKGMLSSNEPGLYRSGEYGIRIENLILCIDAPHGKGTEPGEFGSFLAFETMSLCPFETGLIMPELLSSTEIQWINDYHSQVEDALLPFLDGADAEFLRDACRPIGDRK